MCRINIKEILKDRDYPTAGEYVYSIMEEILGVFASSVSQI